MTIQQKNMSLSVADSKPVIKPKTVSLESSRDKIIREMYEDVAQSLESLKTLIRSTQQAVNKDEYATDATYQKTLEYIDGIIQKSQRRALDFNPPKVSERLPSLELLTKREQEVLKLIATGLANKNIAKKLNISIRTVEVHRSNLIRKLDIRTTAGLVKYAISNAIV